MPSDRRTVIRYSTALQTFCQQGQEARLDHFWRSARVHDVSAGGIGLLLDLQLDPETILTVELPNRHGSHLAQVRVIHAHPLGQDGWLTGCTFLEQLGAEDLRVLLL